MPARKIIAKKDLCFCCFPLRGSGSRANGNWFLFSGYRSFCTALYSRTNLWVYLRRCSSVINAYNALLDLWRSLCMAHCVCLWYGRIKFITSVRQCVHLRQMWILFDVMYIPMRMLKNWMQCCSLLLRVVAVKYRSLRSKKKKKKKKEEEGVCNRMTVFKHAAT